MNKREILQRAVDWWLAEEKHKYGGAPEWVFAAREELDKESEPAPPRNLLAVDENTPEGTLCWFWDDDEDKYVSAGYLDSVLNGIPRKKNGLRWGHAERLLGIHLLPNPGQDKPPVSGEVFIIQRNGHPMVCDVHATDDWLLLNRLSDILWFAPVEWKDGQLVIREEALR